MENSHSNFVDQYSLQERLTRLLLNQTLIALRTFVNDEINELEFALRCVASQFLKPINGTLIVKLNSVSMINLISYKKLVKDYPSNFLKNLIVLF